VPTLPCDYESVFEYVSDPDDEHRYPHVHDLPTLAASATGHRDYQIEIQLEQAAVFPVPVPKATTFALAAPPEPGPPPPEPEGKPGDAKLRAYITVFGLGAKERARQLGERNDYERRRRLWEQWDAKRKAHEESFEQTLAAWRNADQAWRQGWELDSVKLRETKSGYEASDAEMVAMWMAMHLDALPLPAWCPRRRSFKFDPAERVLVLDCQLPYFPSFTVFKTDRKSANQKETREFSTQYLCLLVLRQMWEVAQLDSSDRIALICCNGSVAFNDPATGRPREDVIMSVAATPAELRQLVLDKISPETCFRKLKGVAAPKLSDLVPVQPIIQFNRNDSRFIAGKDVLREVTGMNLATMDWQDFEFLIRELFERAYAAHGAEVRVTQASRDRGVDAVIFDPDPLRGGKTIIQAKRYTATVDVSAVRDLYGTVVNEGANKGILVTTSNFGPDSHEFAKGKPLTLLNGANLLHLLHQHGYEARIDLKEARELLRNQD
jgi:restriction system protein